MLNKKYSVGDYAYLGITVPTAVIVVVVVAPFYLIGRLFALVPWCRGFMDEGRE